MRNDFFYPYHPSPHSLCMLTATSVAVPVSRSLAVSEPLPPLHTLTVAHLEGNATLPPHPSRHSSALHPTTFSLTVPCLPILPQAPLSCLPQLLLFSPVSFQILGALLAPIHSSTSSVLHPPVEYDMYTPLLALSIVISM